MSLNVALLGMTNNSLQIIYSAARQCYFDGWVYDIWPNPPTIDSILTKDNNIISKIKMGDLITKIINSGHTSIIEHVNFTFAISGISRSLSHQLVRHRIASYSQQSQRYCAANHTGYITPPRIESDPELKKEYDELMTLIWSKYEYFQGRLFNKYGDSKVNEDARYILPNATETKIITTMNCRALSNFFGLRCCGKAQWEIRKLANKMLNICQKELPVVFNRMGPRCIALGKCPETKSCGYIQTKLNDGGIKND